MLRSMNVWRFISGYSEGRDDNQGSPRQGGQRRRMRRPRPRRSRGESDGDDRKERSVITSNLLPPASKG